MPYKPFSFVYLRGAWTPLGTHTIKTNCLECTRKPQEIDPRKMRQDPGISAEEEKKRDVEMHKLGDSAKSLHNAQVTMVKMLHGTMSAGFFRWRGWASAVRQRACASVLGLRAAKRCAQRMSRRRLGRALASWCRFSATTALAWIENFSSCTRNPLRVFRRLEHSGLWLALRTWAAAAGAIGCIARQKAVAVNKALSTLRQIIGRVLCVGWRRWTHCCHALCKCERLITTCTHIVVCNAWRAWISRCARLCDSERGCRLASRVADRVEYTAVFAAMRTWINVYRWCGVQRLKVSTASSKAAAILNMSAKRSMMKAWRTWVMRVSVFLSVQGSCALGSQS